MEHLTGKNKEQFEKFWLDYCNSDEFGNKIDVNIKPNDKNIIAGFYEFKPEMQSGVITAYFESVGIYFEKQLDNRRMLLWDYSEKEPEEATIIDCEHIECENTLAWNFEAFKQANTIINKQLKD